VTLRVGTTKTTFTAPAGIFARTVPLATGNVSAEVVRSSVTVASVASPHSVLSSVPWWDLQYYAAASRIG